MPVFGIALLICLLNLFEYTTPKIKKKHKHTDKPRVSAIDGVKQKKGFLNVKNGPLTSSRGNLGMVAQACSPSSTQEEAGGRLPAWTTVLSVRPGGAGQEDLPQEQEAGGG